MPEQSWNREKETSSTSLEHATTTKDSVPLRRRSPSLLLPSLFLFAEMGSFFAALAARWGRSFRRASGPRLSWDPLFLRCIVELSIGVFGVPRQLWALGQLALFLRSLAKKVELQEARRNRGANLFNSDAPLAQAAIIREANLGPFPRCWNCDSCGEVIYALRDTDLYYCGPCWQSFLVKAGGDWDSCRPTLTMANPPACPKCSGPGPCFAETGEQGGAWFCAACWGEALPGRVLQYPPPLLPMPAAPRRHCGGLVSSDYRIVAENCGIWPTVRRNMAVLRPAFS